MQFDFDRNHNKNNKNFYLKDRERFTPSCSENSLAHWIEVQFSVFLIFWIIQKWLNKEKIVAQQ